MPQFTFTITIDTDTGATEASVQPPEQPGVSAQSGAIWRAIDDRSPAAQGELLRALVSRCQSELGITAKLPSTGRAAQEKKYLWLYIDSPKWRRAAAGVTLSTGLLHIHVLDALAAKERWPQVSVAKNRRPDGQEEPFGVSLYLKDESDVATAVEILGALKKETA